MDTRNKTYFISDLHLGSSVFGDTLDREKRLVRWLDSIKDDAGALYLLGDIFDFWFEYREAVPRGFTRFLGKLAELSDSGVEVHFFIGNHDIWAFDYLPKETGLILHREPFATQIAGKNFYIAHGDGLGDNCKSFKLIRAVFHNKACQFLFRLIHPDWGIKLAHKWAAHSRKKEKKYPLPYMGEEKEDLINFSKKYILTYPETDYLIFGHRHLVLDLMLSPRSRFINVGDWLSLFSYAVFDGEELSITTYTS